MFEILCVCVCERLESNLSGCGGLNKNDLHVLIWSGIIGGVTLLK